MSMKKDNFNIMKNIKIIEDLKAQLLCIIGEFFRLLTKKFKKYDFSEKQLFWIDKTNYKPFLVVCQHLFEFFTIKVL